MSWRLTMVTILLMASAAGQAGERRIALSFDDAPRADTWLSSQQRTVRLLDHLEQQGATAIFYVTTGHLVDDRADRLTQYVQAGHVLGNHSHSHRSANRESPANWLADIQRAHEILGEQEGYVPRVRFPMLHEGGSIQDRDAIRQGLAEMGLEHGYVTVDNYDWYLEALFQEAALQAGDAFDPEPWKDFYVDHVLASVEFYDGVAQRHLGRSPDHVLLLHENDLAALFLDDLVAALKKTGWSIIPPGQAYRDAIDDRLPDTLFNGQGRVAALAAERGVPYSELVQASEEEAWLRAEARRRGLVH